MKKYILLFIVLTVCFSCTHQPETVNIGFEVRLLASKSNIIPFHGERDSIFDNYLKSNRFQHYLGKIFVLFDTIITSTLAKDFSIDNSNLLNVNAVLINEMNYDKGLKSLFYRVNGFYVYRTLIPEKEQEQTIFADVGSNDSTLISGYFLSQKMKGLIIR